MYSPYCLTQVPAAAPARPAREGSGRAGGPRGARRPGVVSPLATEGCKSCRGELRLCWQHRARATLAPERTPTGGPRGWSAACVALPAERGAGVRVGARARALDWGAVDPQRPVGDCGLHPGSVFAG